MPAQQISPSAASRSPTSSATLQASTERLRNPLRPAPDPRHPFTRHQRPNRSVRRRPARTPNSRNFFAMRQALRTWSTNFSRSSVEPIARTAARRRPDWSHHGADGKTRDPAIFSANLLNPVIGQISMETWGSYKGRGRLHRISRHLPAAFAVKSSIVSRSKPRFRAGLPFPTNPGHIALWSFGKLL